MKKILALALVCPSLLFAAPASDTNIVAGFLFSQKTNYNLLIPVSKTNGTIVWTNLLLGVVISNSIFYGTNHGTNTSGGGGGDTLWGTNVVDGGITNNAGPGYLAVWVKTGALWMGVSPLKAAISSDDGSAVFANALLDINALGSIRRNTNFSFEGSSGAFALGVSPLYSTNFGQVVVHLTNKVFEIDATNYTVRFQNNRWAFTNGVAHGDGSGISNIIAPIFIYTNTTPTAEGVFPTSSNRSAIAYKLDGTDMMYTWNTNTFTWQ